MILKQVVNLPYAPKPNTGHWIKSSVLPDDSLVTSCFAIVKYQDSLVFVKHITRGVEIAGGHKENESSIECLKREIQEEIGVNELKNISLLAYQEIHVTGSKPDGYKYPYPRSYQLMFVSETDKLDHFEKNLDSVGREVVAIKDIKNHAIYKEWKFLLDLVV